MTKEDPTTQASNWVAKQSQPYLEAGLPRPEFSVLEISRSLGISCQAITRSLDRQLCYADLANPKRVDKRFNQIIARRQLKRRRPWDPKRISGKNKVAKYSLREQIAIELGQQKAKIRLADVNSGRPRLTPTKWDKRALEMSQTPPERLFSALNKLSFFPTQNPETILARAKQAFAENRPFKLACFVCLNITLENMSGEPKDRIVPTVSNTRLSIPKIFQRTEQIAKELEKTDFSVKLIFIVSDTDATDIYGQWLADDPAQLETKESLFTVNFTRLVSPISPVISVVRWSEIQQPFQNEYASNFTYAYQNAASLAGKEMIDSSIARRKKYFKQKGITVETPSLRNRWEDAARKNIALYAAQGPILSREFDCLIIADPDPIKLGRNQSLLCPQLPIWYPYPG